MSTSDLRGTPRRLDSWFPGMKRLCPAEEVGRGARVREHSTGREEQMIKWTLGTVGILALAACAQQEPPAAPASPPADVAPAPAPVAVSTAPGPVTTANAPALPPATNEERAKLFQDCWALFNAKDWAKFP